MSGRPWTPGEWDADEFEIAALVHDHCEEYCANQELIALAPEMAEAILAWRAVGDAGPEMKWQALEKAEARLTTLAERLSQIGEQ